MLVFSFVCSCFIRSSVSVVVMLFVVLACLWNVFRFPFFVLLLFLFVLIFSRSFCFSSCVSHWQCLVEIDACEHTGSRSSYQNISWEMCRVGISGDDFDGTQ